MSKKMDLIRIPNFLEPSSAASTQNIFPIWITSTLQVEMSLCIAKRFLLGQPIVNPFITTE